MTLAITSAVMSTIALFSLTGNVLILFAMKFGARPAYIGALSFALMVALTSRTLTMPSLEKRGKIWTLIFWNVISLFFIPPLIVLGLLAGRITAPTALTILFAVSFLRMMTHGMGETGWFPLLHDIVPHRLIGRFFGVMRTAWQTAAMVFYLLIGFFLGKDSPWWKFVLLFSIALIAYILRLICLSRCRESHTHRQVTWKQILDNHIEVLRNRQLRWLTIYMTLFAFACGVMFPFRITLLKELGYGDGFIIIGADVMNCLGAILSLRQWGRLSDRFGNRPVLGATFLLVPIATLGWLVVRPDQHLYIAALFFISSISLNGNMLIQTRYQMRIIPADKQNLINAMCNIIYLFSGLGPLVGGWILHLTETANVISPRNAYDLVFVLSSLLFLGPALIRRRLTEPADRTTKEVAWVYTRDFLQNLSTTVVPRRRNPRQKD